MTSQPARHSHTVYFSRAIDGIPIEHTLALAKEVAAELQAVGLTMIDPFNVQQSANSNRRPVDIVRSDLRLLRDATAVLVKDFAAAPFSTLSIRAARCFAVCADSTLSRPDAPSFSAALSLESSSLIIAPADIAEPRS